MTRTRSLAYALPPFVDLATGNVHVVPAQRAYDDGLRSDPGASPDAPPAAPTSWVIRDGEGATVDSLQGPRSAALRRMGVIALHGASLPLTLYGPDGHPTGDRLPS